MRMLDAWFPLAWAVTWSWHEQAWSWQRHTVFGRFGGFVVAQGWRVASFRCFVGVVHACRWMGW